LQHQPDHPGDQHIGALAAGQGPGHREQHHQGQGDLQGGDPAGGTEATLQWLEPVKGLGFVEEVAEKNHQQEHAAEGQDPGLRQIQQLAVAGRVMESRIKGLAHPHPAGQGHHQQGAGETHAKHRNHQAPGEEETLLTRRELIEHPGVHHGVVEGEGDLQQQQHQGDPGCREALQTQHDGQSSRAAGHRDIQVAQIAHGGRQVSRAMMADRPQLAAGTPHPKRRRAQETTTSRDLGAVVLPLGVNLSRACPVGSGPPQPHQASDHPRKAWAAASGERQGSSAPGG